MRFLLALIILCFLSVSNSAFARVKARAVESNGGSLLTYDLSASSGSYNGAGYTELTLGLNWVLQDWFTWRNSIFTRQGSGLETVQGLDSSARFSTSATREGGGLGFEAFAGPGLRFASKSNSAIFGEAGVVFKLGGLRIGFGGKVLSYVASRDDAAGAPLPKTDTQYFIILAGGGAL